MPDTTTQPSIDTIHANMQLREARHVQPGWWLRTYNEDETESWDPVHTVMWGHEVTTGRAVTRIIVIDQATGEGVAVANWSTDLVGVVNARTAKRIGLIDKHRS